MANQLQHIGRTICLLAMASWIIPANVLAQDNEASESPDRPENQAEAPSGEADNAKVEANLIPAEAQQTAESEEEEEEEEDEKTVEEMIQFFDGLTQAVASHEGDCAGMAKSISDYYTEHQSWIDDLDYATVNADAAAIEKMRTMADNFGKLLSVCYNSEEIPALLMKYSKF